MAEEGTEEAGGTLESRVDGIEAEQQRQGGLLDQILDKLSGKASPSGSSESGRQDPDGGQSVAELVRQGVEALEAKRDAQAKADSADAERADHADRIRKLEEARPREVAATPAGRFRAAVQKYGFGIDQ